MRFPTRVAPLLFIALLLVAQAVRAAPSGVVAAPLPKGGAALAASLGYVERDVEGGGSIDEARSRRILFKGIFGAGGGVDVYAFFGLADLEYGEGSFSGNLGEDVGFGVRYGGLVLGDGTTRIVFDGQAEYFASEDGDEKSRQQALHVAAYLVGQYGASGRVGHFYPYAGMRLSWAEYDNDNFSDYDSDDPFGLFAGADYFVSPNVFFSGEMHLFDEDSVYLSAGYKF